MGNTYSEWATAPKPGAAVTKLHFVAQNSAVIPPSDPSATFAWPSTVTIGDILIWAWEGNADPAPVGWTILENKCLNGGPNGGGGASNYGLMYHVWNSTDEAGKPGTLGSLCPPSVVGYGNYCVAIVRGAASMSKKASSTADQTSSVQTVQNIPGFTKNAKSYLLLVLQATYDSAALPGLAVPVGFTEIAKAKAAQGYFAMQLSMCEPAGYTNGNTIVSGAYALNASYSACTSIAFELVTP